MLLKPKIIYVTSQGSYQNKDSFFFSRSNGKFSHDQGHKQGFCRFLYLSVIFYVFRLFFLVGIRLKACNKITEYDTAQSTEVISEYHSRSQGIVHPLHGPSHWLHFKCVTMSKCSFSCLQFPRPRLSDQLSFFLLHSQIKIKNSVCKELKYDN